MGVRPRPGKLAKAKMRYPAVTVTEDYRDVLRDAEVDAVLIATPISTHYPLASAAIDAGKHVFVEKPMTASEAEARALIAAAEARGVTLMVGHTFEFSSPVVAIKNLIDSGEIGDIYYVVVEPHQPRAAPEGRERHLGPCAARLLDPVRLAG